MRAEFYRSKTGRNFKRDCIQVRGRVSGPLARLIPFSVRKAQKVRALAFLVKRRGRSGWAKRGLFSFERAPRPPPPPPPLSREYAECTPKTKGSLFSARLSRFFATIARSHCLRVRRGLCENSRRMGGDEKRRRRISRRRGCDVVPLTLLALCWERVVVPPTRQIPTLYPFPLPPPGFSHRERARRCFYYDGRFASAVT